MQSSSNSQPFNSANFEKKNFNGIEKPKDIRRGNILAAKGKQANKYKKKFKFKFKLKKQPWQKQSEPASVQEEWTNSFMMAAKSPYPMMGPR